MKNEKKFQIIRWTARVIAAIVILFGLPFYFGYGNPLPFINPSYSFWDNTWLTIFPLMFLGLALGFFKEKIGGYFASIPLAFGLIIGIFLERELLWFMLFPLIAGIIFIYLSYKSPLKKKKKT